MYLWGNQLLDITELKTYDMRLRAQGVRPPAGNVVIAAIDEKSLSALGRWPWSRGTMAHLIHRLKRLGARVVALDVFFSEVENRKLLNQIEWLESEHGFTGQNSPYAAIKRAFDADSSLEQAIAESGNVVTSMVFLMSHEEARQIPAVELERAFKSIQGRAISMVRGGSSGISDLTVPRAAGVVTNLAAIEASSKFTGHINTEPDMDGTLRWTPLIIQYKDRLFPSADLQAMRAYLGAGDIVLHTASYGITGVQVGKHFIDTDESGRVLINYHGPEKTFATFPIADIYNGSIDPTLIKGKVVLVGPTAQGIGDIRVTPYGTKHPGVEIRANIIQNLIGGDVISRPEWMVIINAVVIIVLGAILSLILPYISMWLGTSLVAVLLMLNIVTAVTLFNTHLVWVNIVYPSVLILLLFISSTIFKYLSAEKSKRQIKSAFQHYVPTAVVDRMIGNIDSLKLGGEKRVLTVLFSDIRDFTSVSESLPPEDLVHLLNVYLTQMTDKVFQHDGLLDKYMGDAIMAIYGAPIPQEDHAIRACRTALDMLDQLRELQTNWKREGLPELDIGIGINTGPMIVGNMGSENRFDYTVIGDAVNIGSRIEALNKIYGTHILMSEFTHEYVKDEFPHLREIDVTRVKGRNEPVKVYELMQPDRYESMDWLPEFERAYKLLRQDEIHKALSIFEHLHNTVRDPVSAYYLNLCRQPARRSMDRKRIKGRDAPARS